MGTGKRLVGYALHYKKLLFTGLGMLAIAVSADLAGPLVAKKIIDEHIVGSAGATIQFGPIATLLAVFF